MARLIVNLEAIRHNARLVAGLCADRGVALTVVTKGVLGDPVIVRELLGLGLTSLGDSRLGNIRRMREAFRGEAGRSAREPGGVAGEAGGASGEYHLIRMPAPSELHDVLGLADVSYHSELEVIQALAEAADAAGGPPHRVVLLVDVGDRREGLMPEDVLPVAARVLSLRGVVLHGLAMSVGCVSGVVPSPANTGLLAELAADLETRLGYRVALVSGGSSTALPLLWGGLLPRGVNHLRVGSAIWLGDYDTWDEPVPGARHDGFDLVAPIIELKWKPSLPAGEIGHDAFGRRPTFEDRGPMLRAICALGRQDTYVEGLEPRPPGWGVVAASSDHLVLDVTRAAEPPAVGDEVSFRLNYGALLYAMQSPAVTKEYTGLVA